MITQDPSHLLPIRRISIRIPSAKNLDSLKLSTTNENMLIQDLNTVDNAEFSSNGGNIAFENRKIGKSISLYAKNGDIRGSIADGYDSFTISCDIKKGNTNLPKHKDGGTKILNVEINNGDADISLIPQ